MSKKVVSASAIFAAMLLLFAFSTPSNAETDKTITFDNLDAVNTSLIAYKNVNDYIDKLGKVSVQPILHISSDAMKRDYSKYLLGAERVSTLWSELVPPNKLNVVLFTENDSNWVDQKQIELTGEWRLDNELQSARIKKYGCNIAGMYLPGVLFFCVKEITVSPGTPEFYPQAHLFSHEYTHFMEMNVKNWMGYVKNTGVGKRNPCWIEEGFATFYGFAAGSNPYGVDGKDRRKFVSELLWSYDDRRNQPHGTLESLIREGKVEETKRLFQMLENTPWPCDETQNAYALGSMAAEALAAVKGQEGMVNFYKSSARTGDWKASFLEVFGISVDNFYEKLTPYLASQYTKSNFIYATPTPSTSASPILTSPTPTPKPTQSTVLPSPSPTASKKIVVSKLITITCIKGKTTKTVTALNPKCPSGYKKK